MPFKITELHTLPRDVVDHEVEHNVMVFGQLTDVGPRTESWIDLAVC